MKNAKHCSVPYFRLFFSFLDSSGNQEYKIAMETIEKVVEKHKSNLKPGVPQLNMCDPAVMVIINVLNHICFVQRLTVSRRGLEKPAAVVSRYLGLFPETENGSR